MGGHECSLPIPKSPRVQKWGRAKCLLKSIVSLIRLLSVQFPGLVADNLFQIFNGGLFYQVRLCIPRFCNRINSWTRFSGSQNPCNSKAALKVCEVLRQMYDKGLKACVENADDTSM